MITVVVLSLVTAIGFGLVFWPLWQGARRPWALEVPGGEEEALRQEQVAALEALRDLALDFKLGNLAESDYRALATPLQQRARRTMQLQESRSEGRVAGGDLPGAVSVDPVRNRHPGGTRRSESHLDALLETQIRAARRTPLSEPPPDAVTVRYCPQCGVSLAAGYRFCPSCGAKLPSPATVNRRRSTGVSATAGVRAALPDAESVAVERGHDTVASDVPAFLPASNSAGFTRASQPAARSWLWRAAAVFAALWVVGVVWLYLSSRAGQENQVPVASLSNVPIQTLAVAQGTLVLGESKGIRTSADGRQWTPLPVAGDIRAVTVMETEGGAVWIAVGPGRLWRSRDGALTWQPVETTPADLRLTTIAAVPGQSGLLWGTDTGALYYSEDGGSRWTAVDTSLPGRPRVLAAGNMELFVGTDRGVFRSSNGGRSWSDFNGSINGAIASTDIQALAYDEANGLLYAGTPLGLSFQKLNSPGSWGERSLRADVTALALDGDDSQVMWVGTADGRIYRSNDRGVTWR